MTHRERLALDEDGKPIVLKNLPNNRLVNNLYSKMVDQKTNYSFGRPLSFTWFFGLFMFSRAQTQPGAIRK